jgi:hypothetical protein
VAGFTSNSVVPVSKVIIDQYRTSAETLAAQAARNLPALLPCDPAKMGDEACADAFIESFGRRAFRRKLEGEERTALRAVYATGGSFANGIRLAIEAILQAPQFVYRPELGGGQPGPDGVVALTGYEVASRLSFFIWNSIPDEPLLAAAEAGMLDDPAGIAEEAARMLRDPKARDGLLDFFRQWTAIEDLDQLTKDSTLFPLFSDKLRASMRTEAELFFDAIVRGGDAKVETLLGARWTYVDAELAKLYGVDPLRDRVAGSAEGVEIPAGFTRVSLAGGDRAGIVSLAGIMARLAANDHTNPITRGKFVRQQILCHTLPDPPPNVPQLPPPDPNSTVREQLAIHRADAACSGCHALTDDIGLGLEVYDAIGQLRTMDHGRPVDSKGLLTATDVDGPFEGGVALAERLVRSEQARSCMATQLFRYFAGRDEEADSCVLADVKAQFKEKGYDMRELVLALVRSNSFRFVKR